VRPPKSGTTARGRLGTSRGQGGDGAAADDVGGGPGTAPGPAGGEFAVIAGLRGLLPGPPPGETWIGDDAAVLAPVAGPLLLTTDLAVAGVHADLSVLGLDDLGWRAFAAAVSDVAAMGGRAHRAVVAVAAPPDTDLVLLYRGIAACAGEHGCPVVGGDLSGAREVVVAVTATGLVPEDGGPLRRDGARPGDTLLVTGPLGASAAGLRVLRAGAPEAHLVEAHRRPRARLREGEVARLAGCSAAIDVSDGLAADLGHLAEASGVGYRLDVLPVAPGATPEEALGGGEDYELVLATPDPDALAAAFAAAGLRAPLRLGVCTADGAQRTLAGEPVPAAGFEHRFAAP